MPATEGTLGLARLDDAETIAAMSRDLIEAGLGWEYRPERVARLMLSPDNVTVVAREGERCVGFALMTFGEDRAHLVLLAVRPTHRRLGIARRMLDWLLASARAAGLLSVHLELVDDTADRERLYRRISEEHDATVDAVLAIREVDQLLDERVVLRRSIQLRNPYVDPMNLIQVELLRRHRAAGGEDPEVARLLARSIAGIAAALRNTG